MCLLEVAVIQRTVDIGVPMEPILKAAFENAELPLHYDVCRSFAEIYYPDSEICKALQELQAEAKTQAPPQVVKVEKKKKKKKKKKEKEKVDKTILVQQANARRKVTEISSN